MGVRVGHETGFKDILNWLKYFAVNIFLSQQIVNT